MRINPAYTGQVSQPVNAGLSTTTRSRSRSSSATHPTTPTASRYTRQLAREHDWKRHPLSGFQVLDDLNLDLNEGRPWSTAGTTS